MAQMWPRRIPQTIRNDPLRAAECHVYDALQKLGDGWVVFYSRPWLGLSRTGEEIDGEADFVVAHPDFGLLSIEVKGGEIACDPATEKWTSTDRHKVTHTIKNPVAQARASKHRILELLKESPHWRPRWIRIRHGVIFTDTSIPRRDFGPDRPRAIFADKQEFSTDIGGWLQRRFNAFESDDRNDANGGLGEDGVRALTKLLAEPFHLRVPLGHFMDDDDHEIEVLTQQQFIILSAIELLPRIVVHGGAGTGKTVLAVETARRAAERGQRTLLTCFNRALATRLALRIGPSVEMRGFHSLCGIAASRAGLSAPKGLSDHELHERILPELLFDAASLLPEFRFDTIVVDEGQDFRTHWWPALESILRPSGRLVIFHDSNQRLYGDIGTLPKELSAQPIPLNQNLRNTDAILEVTLRHYKGAPILPNGIPGLPVDSHVASDADKIRERLVQVVARLSDVEHVAPDDIAIIFAHEREGRILAPAGLVGRVPVAQCDQPIAGAVTMDTVRRFKGLDSRVVIVIATPELSAEPELAYVATSRARTHLMAIGDRNSLANLLNGQASAAAKSIAPA